eukprot:669344-Amphidinium_carterae.1
MVYRFVPFSSILVYTDALGTFFRAPYGNGIKSESGNATHMCSAQVIHIAALHWRYQRIESACH